MAESAASSNSEPPLSVVVSGGGPVGLTFSLNLLAMMGDKVKIQIYEGRWFTDKKGLIRWQGEDHGKIRRDQVVTLQDHVIAQMPFFIQKTLFSKVNERVWPTSRNIPIREVEDRLLDAIEPFVNSGLVELIPENLDENSKCLVTGEYDILVGADGANSFVRRYSNIEMVSEGLEYACGVAYHIPDKVEPHEQPLDQAMNCILTVAQTRYLVNSSTSRRGYLNIRLIKEEYNELIERINKLNENKAPIDLLDFDSCPGSPVWTIIRQGLIFFKIPAKYVFRVVPIQINVRHASVVVRELRFQLNKSDSDSKSKKEYKTQLAFLAGDAAMNVHFWPGRGMNSGMKAAMALARNILAACTVEGELKIRRPLRFLDFIEYEGFMAKLRAREQQGRSLRVLIDPIDPSIEAAYSFAHVSHCYKRYTSRLIAKLKETRDRLQERPEWVHRSRQVTDQELESASLRIDMNCVAQLSLANPWPTREMSGKEVLVEETFPFALTEYLPLSKFNQSRRAMVSSKFVKQYVTNICITDMIESIEFNEIIQEAKMSPMFLPPSNDPSSKPSHTLIVVKNSEEAKSWLKTELDLSTMVNHSVKVISGWRINEQETAIEVIRAVRSILPKAPVLIYTTARDEAGPALEFLNVTITDKKFEVREYIGIIPHAQWNPGYVVTCRDTRSRSELSATFPIVTESTEQTQLLLWLDEENKVEEEKKNIMENYHNLNIIFLPSFPQAEEYMKINKEKLSSQSKCIIICHTYYVEHEKSCVDVATLITSCGLQTSNMAVYTLSPEAVRRYYPDLPSNISIYTTEIEIFDFVTRCLQDG